MKLGNQARDYPTFKRPAKLKAIFQSPVRRAGKKAVALQEEQTYFVEIENLFVVADDRLSINSPRYSVMNKCEGAGLPDAGACWQTGLLSRLYGYGERVVGNIRIGSAKSGRAGS